MEKIPMKGYVCVWINRALLIQNVVCVYNEIPCTFKKDEILFFTTAGTETSHYVKAKHNKHKKTNTAWSHFHRKTKQVDLTEIQIEYWWQEAEENGSEGRMEKGSLMDTNF